MKKSKTNLKSVVVKASAKSLYTLADIFSSVMCHGRWYEPKMPEKLRK